MIITPSHRISSRFENNLNNAVNNDTFSGVNGSGFSDGSFGRDLDLSASGSYVEMGLHYVGSQINGAPQVTLSLRFKPNSTTPARQDIFYGVIKSATSWTAGLYLGSINNTDLRVISRSIANPTVDPASILVIPNFFIAGVERFICVVVDYTGKTITAFDKKEQIGQLTGAGFTQNTYTHTTNAFNAPDRIGIDPLGSNKFTGKVDNVFLWRGGLGLTDIKRIALGLHPLNG